MSLYRNVHVSMWGDAKFRALSDDGKILWLYLLTGPETTSAPGCIAIGRASLAEALDWETERLDEAFAELVGKGMARADWRARLVWLPNAIRYIVPASWQHVKGWIPYIQILPECALKDQAVGTIWSYVLTRSKEAQGILSEAFGDAYLERCLSSLDTPSDTPLHTLSDTYQARAPDPHPIKDQDQDQDQDQEIPPYPPASQGDDEGAPSRESKGRRKRKERQLSDAALAVRSEIRERLGVDYPPSAFDALEAQLQAKELSPEDALVLTRWACGDPFWGGQAEASPSTLFRPKHFAELLAKARAAATRPSTQAHHFPGREPIPDKYARL